MKSTLGPTQLLKDILAGQEVGDKHQAKIEIRCNLFVHGSLRQVVSSEVSRREQLEAALSRRTEAFRRFHANRRVTPATLQGLLPNDTLLIDFFEYVVAGADRKGKAHLVAFVVGREKIIRVEMGEADSLGKVIERYRATMERRTRPVQGKEDPAALLRHVVWQPLEKHLAGAKRVLLSPDGPLCRLPFAALPNTDGSKYLLEEVALAIVPVPQLLPELLAPVPKGSRLKPSLLVVGDVDFDKAAVLVAKAGDRSAPRGSLKGWGKLDATAAEVAAIRETFTDRFEDGKVASLRKRKATKAAVCEALRKSRFAHLATHGFFAPPDLKSALGSADRNEQLFGKEGVSGWHPLLLSGVVLSGANREAKPGEDDGILTALEVSEMDLSGCELVVLSACETGLGKVAGGEGVLGLQRAFQVAGAGSVVASLWKVDDGATRDLMVGFYKHLWDEENPLSRIEALRQAQLSMLREGYKRGMVRRKEEDKGERVPPLYWAAFVLSGDWR